MVWAGFNTRISSGRHRVVAEVLLSATTPFIAGAGLSIFRLSLTLSRPAFGVRGLDLSLAIPGAGFPDADFISSTFPPAWDSNPLNRLSLRRTAIILPVGNLHHLPTNLYRYS